MAAILAVSSAEPGQRPDPVAMAVAHAISQRRIVIPDPDTPEGRQEMLRRMRSAKLIDYQLSVYTGCHAYVEVNGFKAALLDAYGRLESEGRRWVNADIHSAPLEMNDVELAYFVEKLGCIFGRKVALSFPLSPPAP